MNINLTKVASVALAPLTMAAITIATAASASAVAPTAVGFGVQQPLDNQGPGGPDTGPDPNSYYGGQSAGGTGPAPAVGQSTDPGFWTGGEAAGGTGPASSGPNTGSGPGQWEGGESAGGI